MKKTFQLLILAACIASFTLATTARAQGTKFTYQGRLHDSGSPANGSYDLSFSLFNVSGGGAAVAGPVALSPVAVSNGLFTVTLDFGAGIFNGTTYWLQISARTNGAVLFTSVSPRQELTPTPYAIYAEGSSAAGLAGTIPSANLTGAYGNALTLNNAGNSFSGNGSGLLNVNAALLGGLGAAQFWQLGGNAGTTPGVNYLGTPDNQALELKVNNARGLRIEPDPSFAIPNLIGGNVANYVKAGTVGNVIGGGGWSFTDTMNFIDAVNLNVISGGYGNRITNSTYEGTIGGGAYNTVSATEGVVSGGGYNLASGLAATVPGGENNQAAGSYSFAAGHNAQASHDGAFVWADNSTSTSFASAAANQFLVRSRFMGINRNYTIGGNEYFGILAPITNDWGGMYIQTLATGRPFYGYNNPSWTSWTEMDGTDGNKWKLYNGGYQMTVTTSGNVGLGTTTPTDKLDVEGNIRINDHALLLRAGGDINHGLAYSNTIAGQYIDGPVLWGYNGGALGGVNTTPVDTVTLKWDWLGNVWISNNCSVATLTIRGGADLAEPFNITSGNKEVPQGAVVVIDDQNPGHLKMSDQPYDARVAGVVSGANGVNPGIQMQQQGLIEGSQNVALTGRVYVQADASNGAIRPGDMLTTSRLPGYAMKVTNHAKAQGAILGKAMTGLSEGKGMVLVLVTLQ